MTPLFLGIEIGGTKLQLVLGHGDGRIVTRQRHQIAAELGAEGIRSQLAVSIPELIKGQSIAATAIGFGGPVNRTTGRIACSHQVTGWSDFPLAEWVSGKTKVPTIIENDANTAALGEALAGAGKGQNPMFYVTLGSGVGGGLVVDGAIYHGAAPGEAEIGHIRLDKGGSTVESRCSGWAADKAIRAAIADPPGSKLAELCQGMSRGESRHLAPALAAGDPLAQYIISRVADDLAFGLSHVVHLMHPEMIVLGGGLSLVGEPLRAAVQAALPQYIMEVFHPGPKIALASLAEDTVPVGALLLAGQNR